MPKHFFFDLDNTLTPSKALIEAAHVPVLKKLGERADITVVSGHGENDIRKHLTLALEGLYHILGQNGNVAQTKDGRVLWKRPLSQAQKDAARTFIEKAQKHLNYTIRDENDIVEDRGSQIAFSLIGHHENQVKKEDCIYIGDALFPGGNDETVIGILPVKAVKNYKETYLYLEHLLRS